MYKPKFCLAAAAIFALIAPAILTAQNLTIEGAPTDTGFNVGTPAGIRATVQGVTGDPSRYAVFAEIQYIGTTAVSSFQLDRVGDMKDGEAHYEGGWPIPADAPTGVYSVKIQVEDRKVRKAVATQAVRGFAAYRKLVTITKLRLDKTFYTVGDPIQCEVAIQNLSGRDLTGLRVEFSNANYPWIASYSEEAGASGGEQTNPELDLNVLREKLDLPAQGEVAIPMMPAGTARFLQGRMVAMLGAGSPPSRRPKLTSTPWRCGTPTARCSTICNSPSPPSSGPRRAFGPSLIPIWLILIPIIPRLISPSTASSTRPGRFPRPFDWIARARCFAPATRSR